MKGYGILVHQDHEAFPTAPAELLSCFAIAADQTAAAGPDDPTITGMGISFENLRLEKTQPTGAQQ